MADKQIRLGIDASSAQQGADEWTRTTDQIRAKARLTAEGIRDLERSLGVTAQSFGRSGAQVSTTAKNALGSLFQYNQQIASSLKQTADSANKVGASIFAALQRAGSTVISTGGNIRAGVGHISGELLGAAGNAEGMAAALGLSAGAVGPLLAVGSGIAAIGAGLVFGTKKAFELDASLAHLASRTPTGDIKPYEQQALRLAKALGVDAVQAAGAFEAAAFSGIARFEDQVSAATLGLKLFKTEGIDAAQAVGLIDAALDAYDEPATKAAEKTNEILALAIAGETRFADMASAIATVGPKAKSLGVDMVDLGSVLATLAPKTGGAVNAAASLQTLLLQLSDPTSNVSKEIREQGVIFDEHAIRTKGLGVAMRDLAKGFEGREDLLARVFGNPRIAQAAFILLQDGGKKTTEAMQAARTSLDQLGEGFDKTEALASSKWDKLVKNVVAGATEMGEGLKGILGELYDLPNILDSISSKSEAFSRSGGFEIKQRPGELFTDEDISRLDKARGELDAIGSKVKLITASEFSKEGFIVPESGKTVSREDLAALDAARDKFKTLLAQKRALAGGEGNPEIEPPLFRSTATQRPPNIVDGEKKNLPELTEFERSMQTARETAESLAASLQTKLGTALEQEIAKVRESEDEIRKKIASYNDLGINTEKLTAQLFALTNQDDALVEKMRRTAAQEKSDVASAQRTADARMKQAKATQQLGEASLLAFVGAKALAEQIGEQHKQNKAFDQGPGQMLKDIQFQNDLIGRTSDEVERLTAARQFDADAAALEAQANKDSVDGFDFLSARVSASRVELERLLADRALKQKADQLGHAIADPLTDGLGAVLTRTKSFGDALVDVYRDIVANILKQSVLGPANQGLSGFFSKLLGGFGGGGGGGGGGGSGGTWDFGSEWARGGVFQNGSPIAFANGGMPWSSSLVPFARGDIVSRATRFPMSRGRTGVMGEAGTEAIMPVARGPSGRLGVQVVGGSRGSSEPRVANVDNSRSYTTTILLNKADDRRSVRQAMDDQRRLYAST